jgi:hypothetical protein
MYLGAWARQKQFYKAACCLYKQLGWKFDLAFHRVCHTLNIFHARLAREDETFLQALCIFYEYVNILKLAKKKRYEIEYRTAGCTRNLILISGIKRTTRADISRTRNKPLTKEGNIAKW